MLIMYTKLFLKFLLFLFTNHVTNVLTEVVPYCKSGHILLDKIAINLKNDKSFNLQGNSKQITITSEIMIYI